MTRLRIIAFLAVAATAAVAVGGTVAVARDGRDDRVAARAAATASAAPPLRVVLPGRPGESAAVGDSDSVKAPEAPTYNTVDVTFVRMMIAHHAQALRMAQLGAERAGDQRVRALAERISAAQGPEIERMRAWLTERRLTDVDPGHDHATMPGMQSEAAVQSLGALRGPDFDKRFLTMMSAHHRGAVEMAGDVLTAGSDQTIGELANELAVEQQSEIRRMEQLGLR
jgi:uncharacterized protein (DUF305 family)